jgi:hypothetical protein
MGVIPQYGRVMGFSFAKGLALHGSFPSLLSPATYLVLMVLFAATSGR